jgi:hypothetical protein
VREYAMQITDVQLRDRPSVILSHVDPSVCVHAWEPHLWERGRAYCPRCGSYARWVDDPRLSGEEDAW